MMKRKYNSGSAIPIVLIFSAIMLIIGLAYSKMVQTSKTQTIQIDERIKLDLAIESMAELALLKYQLFPADFYVCKDLKKRLNNSEYFDQFLEKGVTGKDAVFWQNNTDMKSSFNETPVHIELRDMDIVTTEKWKTEALQVIAYANYIDIFKRDVDKTGVRFFELDRITDTSPIDSNTKKE